MSETHDRTAKNSTGRTLRPKAVGHVWAWIVLAIGLVLCMIITLWVVEAGTTTVNSFADQEVVHTVARRLEERWSQVPGPPETYRDGAHSSALAGDLEGALRLTAMALALEPDHVDSWVHLVCLSCVRPAASSAMTLQERDQLTAALEDLPEAPIGLQAALAIQAQNCASEGHTADDVHFLSQCLGVEIPLDGLKTEHRTLDTLDVSP